ncbi:MAG TPA: PIN domain-containing protein [Acidobacteriaceae bacterium]|nr:PIN domain-containing protein [Acidobacteriaceae bacterium]
MILADTSIWIDLFRRGRFKAELERLIKADQLCIHPFIVAELACGYLPDRLNTLTYLDNLNHARPVRLADVRLMIEARNLASKGIRLTDAHLIASCLATPGTQIWTIDTPLRRVTELLGIHATPPF